MGFIIANLQNNSAFRVIESTNMTLEPDRLHNDLDINCFYLDSDTNLSGVAVQGNVGSNNDVSYTIDGGLVWSPSNIIPNTFGASTYFILLRRLNNRYYICSSRCDILYSSTGESGTWTTISKADFWDDGSFVLSNWGCIGYNNDDNIMIFLGGRGDGFGGIAYRRSTDGGLTWDADATPFSLGSNPGFQNIFYIGGRFVLTGGGGNMYSTDGAGTNWVYNNSEPYLDNAVFSNSQIIGMDFNGKVWRTSDGVTWDDLGIPSPLFTPDSEGYRQGIRTTDNKIMFTGWDNVGAENSIFWSDDNGDTWNVLHVNSGLRELAEFVGVSLYEDFWHNFSGTEESEI